MRSACWHCCPLRLLHRKHFATHLKHRFIPAGYTCIPIIAVCPSYMQTSSSADQRNTEVFIAKALSLHLDKSMCYISQTQLTENVCQANLKLCNLWDILVNFVGYNMASSGPRAQMKALLNPLSCHKIWVLGSHSLRVGSRSDAYGLDIQGGWANQSSEKQQTQDTRNLMLPHIKLPNFTVSSVLTCCYNSSTCCKSRCLSQTHRLMLQEHSRWPVSH